MTTVMLVDGNSLTYRAFFALPSDMATASGQVTNAVFGFTSMLINLLKDHHPDRIAVAFDRPEPTFRHAFLDDYKAGRQEAPDILRQQIGLVRQVVEALQIPVVELPGYEADDIIATLATQARDRGEDVIVVTGDRDVYQLVEDPRIRVLYNRRGVSDYVLYDEAGIRERTGVDPRQYPEYAALRGDPSDNLPGVPGVGEKTAAKLINDFGSIDGVYANLDKLTPKLRASLAEHEDRVRLNARATPLVRDVPVDVDVDALRMGGWSVDEVRDLFNFLEFRSLWDRLVEATAGVEVSTGGDEAEALDVRVRRVTDAGALVAELLAAGAAVAIEAAWTGAPGRSDILGVAFAPLGGDDEAIWLDGALVGPALAPLTAPGGVGVEAHRAKELMRGLESYGIDITTLDVDTAVAAYLVDPAEALYLLEDLVLRYLRTELRSPDALPTGQLDLDGVGTDPAEETARRAVAIARLAPALTQVLEARNLRALYDGIERPLVRVLARMERVGVRVDTDILRQLNDELTTEVRTLERTIQDLAGEDFKVNSTPQLRAVLFDRLGLQPQKKTKTGYSTDAASLEKLLGQHPIIEALLRYREVEKLRSTYGEGLLAEVAPDGRIHASFNQTVARTGRLSSDQPNLHNIPVRSEDGRRFRRAFIPSEGSRFLIADYNQIELRVIAHLAEDPGLVEAFRSGTDIHTATAARIFHVDPTDVTVAMRSRAKMVSYGLAYGMEAFGLAQRLGIERAEAQAILDAYFAAYPSVRAYMDNAVAEARRKGYTETLFGRRRQIPELSSSTYSVRLAGERQAMNAGIQGLAADIFKVALVKLDRALEDASMRARLVLQVHDEVILEVPPDEEGEAEAATRAAMEGAADLRVP
ncbi:MAG TPA: DNA polymerase I, partial [Acidimicrobiales bacterium]|nr:DNA polymerase I [Acidimicrobiales bacterium]